MTKSIVLALALAGAGCGKVNEPMPGGGSGSGGTPMEPDAAAVGPTEDAGVPDGPAPRRVTIRGIARPLVPVTADEVLNGALVFTFGHQDMMVSAGNDGQFEISVAAHEKFSLVGQRSGHAQVILQEMQLGLDDSFFRDLKLPSDMQFDSWTAGLPGYDPAAGLVRVEIRAYGQGACGKAEGATVALDPPAGAVVFGKADMARVPDASLTAAASLDSLAVAYIHGVPAGSYTVTASKSGCTSMPWPYEEPTKAYTGRIDVAAGRGVTMGFAIFR